jgi:hypothetical protein
MPPSGTYLLTNVGFSSEEPLLVFQTASGKYYDVQPLTHRLSFQFDTSQRYCIGWRDITTSIQSPCPDMNIVAAKYEQCSACQQRTGFNPAFYHATSVSPQQELRNQEPHILYLAHFGADVIKVGISHAKRGYGRLLEQGARRALILDTFPTAHIARQYEAKIAQMASIIETVAIRKKITLLTQQAYDPAAAEQLLLDTRRRIETTLSVDFTPNQVLSFDNIYFPTGLPDFTQAHDTTSEARISGDTIGMLGSLLCCMQQGTPLLLALKKYVGYHVDYRDTVTPIQLPARQTSLF